MTRRHAISGIFICMLMLWAAVGSGPAASWAAEMKGAAPAPSVVVASAPETKPDPGTVPEKKSAPTVVPEAKPVSADASETKDFTYVTTGKMDPFKPFIETDPAVKKQVQTGKTKKGAPKGRPLSPLQQAEIEQFRLVGIAGNSEKRTAMVEERASKKFYPLSVGTYIGPNEGRVAQILPDRVVVEERVISEGKNKKSQIKRIPLLLHPEP